MALSPYYWFAQYSQHQSDMQRWSKTKPWRGPVKQAYISETGEPVVLDITNVEDKYKIKDLDLNTAIGVATLSSNGNWTGQHINTQSPLSNVYIKESFSTLEAVITAIRESYAALIAQETIIAASPILQMDRILKERDWYSHFSDDHSYWAAGEANERKFKEILPQVPPDEVRKIWAKYAPKEFPCPV